MKLLKKIIAVSTFIFLSHSASAGVIEGKLSYTNPVSPANIWSFDFDNKDIFIGDGEIDTATGDLSGLLGMSIAPVSFNYANLPGPTQLWSVNGFTYTLETVSVLFETEMLGGVLLLNGNGILSHANYDDTQFNWVFTGNSGVYSANQVAEPATIALLGLGMLGLAYSRKRK